MSENYITTEFKIPEERIYGDQARHLIAKIGDGILPNDLFHYTEEGRPKQGRSPIRFFGRPGRIIVVGVGTVGMELLHSTGDDIGKCLRQHYGHPIPRTWAAGESYMQGEGDRLRRYFTRTILLQTSAAKQRHLLSGDTEAINERIRHLVISGLREEASMLDLDFPDDALADVVSVEGVRPIQVKTGVLLLSATGVVFKFNRRLVGHWQIGSRSSLGYGLVRPPPKVRER